MCETSGLLTYSTHIYREQILSNGSCLFDITIPLIRCYLHNGYYQNVPARHCFITVFKISTRWTDADYVAIAKCSKHSYFVIFAPILFE